MFKITTIIPTYNRISIIERAIDSVLFQSHPVDEIIIIDDGSTDGSRSFIAKKYPQVQLIHQENKGVSAARNLGIANATGNWLAFLDSDDEWLPHKIEKQLANLQQSPEINFCHTEEIWIRNGVRVNQMKKHQKSGGWIYQKCLPLCAISPSTALLKKELVEAAGMFDENYAACEDYDLWLKICAQHPVSFVEEPCIYKYGGHDDQLSEKYWGMDRFRIKALVNMLSGNRLKTDDRLATEQMLLKKITVYNKGAIKRNKMDEVTAYKEILFGLGIQDE